MNLKKWGRCVARKLETAYVGSSENGTPSSGPNPYIRKYVQYLCAELASCHTDART
jgi:hypothetical protein